MKEFRSCTIWELGPHYIIIGFYKVEKNLNFREDMDGVYNFASNYNKDRLMIMLLRYKSEEKEEFYKTLKGEISLDDTLVIDWDIHKILEFECLGWTYVVLMKAPLRKILEYEREH